MDLAIVGPAWPEEHEALQHMARVLEVGLRFQGLPRPAPRRA
ncbi:MAG TPA: hypothetical protein VGR28_08040 [Candidatus Thermoplasmatota archaeon]|jgi:hypothetical protein|nr:hypothetical protein [Candidatus Thermoplasmatota archaeon]